MGWIQRAKRVLRESSYSRTLYGALARAWGTLRVSLYAVIGRRYYAAAHFDRLFGEAVDPWNYGGSPIAEERRALILRALPRNHYARLLEIGCAEGWMTRPLAYRAASLLAADISCTALARARARCRELPNVQFMQFDLLADRLSGTFEGIVCAGVLVFLPADAQASVRDRIVGSLASGGDLLLEHTRQAYPGEVAGNEIHQLYRQHPALTVVRHEEVDNYAVTVFRHVAR